MRWKTANKRRLRFTKDEVWLRRMTDPKSKFMHDLFTGIARVMCVRILSRVKGITESQARKELYG